MVYQTIKTSIACRSDLKNRVVQEAHMRRQTYASVWDALEDTAEASANIRMRAQLMIEIERYVRESNPSQAEAAKRLGITQPRLNGLLRGKIDKFSLDVLVNTLNAVGIHVSIRIKKAA